MRNKKRRDHFVQRLLIRQFLNDQGRVFCFDKAKPGIPDREHGNQPKNILYKRGYYEDENGIIQEREATLADVNLPGDQVLFELSSGDVEAVEMPPAN